MSKGDLEGREAPLTQHTPSDLPCVPYYELLSEIGRGSMGIVYRAWDLRLDREVAIKLLRADCLQINNIARTRFLTEARITGRLQHPGIPPVHELGILPDGRPFLVMKLVQGQTLTDLLRAAYGSETSQVEWGRFLTIFEQICYAVGYAHAHGIIHRDLKPSNIMVGSHGEVQVMDWGLAKELPVSAAAGADHDPLATIHLNPGDFPAGDNQGTQLGSVIGTPAYMSPEQASGEIPKVDARSDVFGLGAILCQILTGQPPYRAAGAYEVRLQAMRGDLSAAFAALDRCGAESDLVALCKRCLAPRQEDRPANGWQVAEEVARLRQAAEERARQAEWAQAAALLREAEQRKRRRQLLVAAGILISVLLAGISGTTLGLIQAHRAADAERLAKLAAEAKEAEALRERDAKIKALAAESTARLAARQACDQALSALRATTDDLVAYYLAGKSLLTEEDKALLRKVMRHFERLASLTADDAESRRIRADGYSRVGTIHHHLGELKEAEIAYRKALALQEELVAEHPAVPDFQQELATGYNNLGVLLANTGRLEEAETAYRAALKLRKQLAAQASRLAGIHRELAASYNNLGNLLHVIGRSTEAEKNYQAALELQKQLTVDFPNQPELRQELATTFNNLGNLLHATGRLEQAEVTYRAALDLQQQLVTDFPGRPEFRRELARGYHNLGILLRTTGRSQEAESSYRQALSLRQQLAKDFPSRPELHQELAITYNSLGNLLYTINQPRQAEAAYRAALEIQRQLVTEHPNRPEFRQELATSYNNLGLLLRATGRTQEAETSYRLALKLRQQLATDFPNRPEFRQELATSYNNLGQLLRAKKCLPEAEQAYRQALEIQKQLAADFPNRPEFRQELATSYNNLGNLLYVTERLAEAEAAYRAALKLRRQLVADFPDQPEIQSDLTGTLVNLALLCNQRGDYQKALAYLDQAEPHHQLALKANPQHPTYRQFYRHGILARVQAQAGLLNHQEAVHTAERLRDLGWNPSRDAYDAACALAYCIPLVLKHRHLNEAERHARVQFYARHAMSMLRTAWALGFHDLDCLKKDPDLEPLRRQAEFQNLVQQLSQKN
jgi:tetratricopeptide (TPR) repeat protein